MLRLQIYVDLDHAGSTWDKQRCGFSPHKIGFNLQTHKTWDFTKTCLDLAYIQEFEGPIKLH